MAPDTPQPIEQALAAAAALAVSPALRQLSDEVARLRAELVVARDSRRLLSIREVAERLGCSTRTVRRWRAEGRMPEPIRGGERPIRWRSLDIDLLLQEPANAR